MLNKKFNVKKGDTVMVIAGKEKSKTGNLIKVNTADDSVIIEGLNIVKRHVRARGNESGTVLEKEAPLHVSNIMLYCPSCSRPVRSRVKLLEDKKKVRVCVKCGETFDK